MPVILALLAGLSMGALLGYAIRDATLDGERVRLREQQEQLEYQRQALIHMRLIYGHTQPLRVKDRRS